MKHINRSPIDNSKLTSYISCKDHTVSGEIFNILIDKTNELLITSPRPKDEDLGNFYKSTDYISHTDTKKSLIDRVYQIVRNYTIKQKIRLINSLITEDKSVLDIGAGTGDFLVACKRNGWDVYGVEPSLTARKIAEAKLGLKLSTETSDHLDKKYDVITMWHVLEHVPDINQTISNLKQLLKPNGVLVVAVPNYKSFDARYYKEFWAAYDTPRHLWHFSQKAIENLFTKESMTIAKILPMKFDAYYVSLLSEKYKNGWMNPFKAFFIGLNSNIKASSSNEYSSLIYIIRNA